MPILNRGRKNIFLWKDQEVHQELLGCTELQFQKTFALDSFRIWGNQKWVLIYLSWKYKRRKGSLANILATFY